MKLFQDVALYAAACFGELLCIYAPDPDAESALEPFSDNDHKVLIDACSHMQNKV